MPWVCEYLYHKGANRSWFYWLTVAEGEKKGADEQVLIGYFYQLGNSYISAVQWKSH